VLIYLDPAISNVIWGAGGIVAKLGIVDANPLLFLLIRAGIAGPFLSAVAFIIHRELPAPAFWPRTLLGGVTVFFDQCFYIVGIKISSGTTSSGSQRSRSLPAPWPSSSAWSASACLR
jgi:drug/metabolite transporter (DMT)-like permease